MLKRFFDVVISLLSLTVLSPLLFFLSVIIWLYDRKSPFYIAPRVGKHGRIFKMFKFRTMQVGADKNKVDSTSANDPRITHIGVFIRKCKLDELPQLFNVLLGQMSIVGPRPNVARETALYTDLEKQLLAVRPGITDFASVVFADEGEILKESKDPDIDYNQLIRPWKSELGLFYIKNMSVLLDLQIILATAIAPINRTKSLQIVSAILKNLSASDALLNVSSRKEKLVPAPPPGASTIVLTRNIS